MAQSSDDKEEIVRVIHYQLEKMTSMVRLVMCARARDSDAAMHDQRRATLVSSSIVGTRKVMDLRHTFDGRQEAAEPRDTTGDKGEATEPRLAEAMKPRHAAGNRRAWGG